MHETWRRRRAQSSVAAVRRLTLLLAAAAAAWFAGAPAPSAQYFGMDPGEFLFGECRDCHNFAEGAGPGRKAPNLWSVYGRTAGTAPGWEYTRELKASGIVWTETTMERWLRNPGAMVPGTKMDFQMPNDEQRELVLEYMRNADPAGYVRAIQGLK